MCRRGKVDWPPGNADCGAAKSIAGPVHAGVVPGSQRIDLFMVSESRPGRHWRLATRKFSRGGRDCRRGKVRYRATERLCHCRNGAGRWAPLDCRGGDRVCRCGNCADRLGPSHCRAGNRMCPRAERDCRRGHRACQREPGRELESDPISPSVNSRWWRV
jgi:hypothetical protein